MAQELSGATGVNRLTVDNSLVTSRTSAGAFPEGRPEAAGQT